MPRPRKIDRPRKLELKIPDSIYVKIKAELYSDIEGKVPFGAISAVGVMLFSDWLRERGHIL